jgi:hypothetical protein
MICMSSKRQTKVDDIWTDIFMISKSSYIPFDREFNSEQNCVDELKLKCEFEYKSINMCPIMTRI